MKLKCVESLSSYLTEGKLYEFNGNTDDGFWFHTDDSERAYQWKLSGCHGVFEIVEEQPETSPALTPRSLGCFQEVADVIGEDAAEIELQRVIDSGIIEDLSCIETKEVSGAFTWVSSPQGQAFWDAIDDGVKPENYDVNQKSTQDSPVFGDVLDYNGGQVVYLSNLHSGCHLVSFENGVTLEVTLDELDKYKPNETQELRNRILERWQRKTLDNSHDTEVCIAEMRVSDLIDFVVDNLNAEYSGD